MTICIAEGEHHSIAVSHAQAFENCKKKLLRNYPRSGLNVEPTQLISLQRNLLDDDSMKTLGIEDGAQLVMSCASCSMLPEPGSSRDKAPPEALYVGHGFVPEEQQWVERQSRHGVTQVVPIKCHCDWREGCRRSTFPSTGVIESQTIAKYGFSHSREQRGVYSAFDIQVAFKCARKIRHEERWYQIVVQNLFDPREVLKLDNPHGWLCVTPNGKEITILPHSLSKSESWSKTLTRPQHLHQISRGGAEAPPRHLSK